MKGVIFLNTGQRLKKLREEKGLSQTEIAKILGVDRTTYVKWETGVSSPLRKLNKLVEFFNVSSDYLLGTDIVESVPKTSLTNKDNKEITEMLEEMKEKLQNEEGLMFDGNPATPESVQSILDAMQIGMEMAKKRNKEKYTPKKYKK